MILVVGGTGQLGNLIVRKLLRSKRSVRILIRPDSNFGPLVNAGAKPVYGDLLEPITLVEALRGASAVITTANSMQRGGTDDVQNVDLIGNRHLINTARSMGVKRFIYISDHLANERSASPFLHAKKKTEQHLVQSGLEHTILAFEPLVDVWMEMAVRPAVQGKRPVVLVGNGDRKHSFMTLDDAASFTVATVDDRSTIGQYIALGGPQPMSWNDLIETCSRLKGERIPTEHRSAEAAFPEYSEAAADYLAQMELADTHLDSSAQANRFKLHQTRMEDYLRGLFAGMVEKGHHP